MEDKKCKECRKTYPISFFRINSNGHTSMPKRARCKGCEQNKRDTGCRYKRKARSTRRNHAKSYGMSVADFTKQFGWDNDQLAHDFEHAWKNGCSYCRHPYSDMSNGLRDMTVDIVDRSRPPHYRTNVKICCSTCNTKKGRDAPDEWEDDIRCHAIWAENKRQRDLEPHYNQQSLFDK